MPISNFKLDSQIPLDRDQKEAFSRWVCNLILHGIKSLGAS